MVNEREEATDQSASLRYYFISVCWTHSKHLADELNIWERKKKKKKIKIRIEYGFCNEQAQQLEHRPNSLHQIAGIHLIAFNVDKWLRLVFWLEIIPVCSNLKTRQNYVLHYFLFFFGRSERKKNHSGNAKSIEQLKNPCTVKWMLNAVACAVSMVEWRANWRDSVTFRLEDH